MNEILSKSLKEIEATTKLATEDLSGCDFRSRPGLETRKRMAESALPKLIDTYKNQVQNHIVKIFLSGSNDHVARFCQIPGIKDGAVVLRGDSLYRKFAEPIEKMVDPRKRLFDSAQFTRLIQEMYNFASDNEIKSLPLPKLDANDYSGGVATFEDTVRLVKKAIRTTTEDDLNKFYLNKEALDTAVAQKLDREVVPVIISHLSESEAKNLSAILFPGRRNIFINLDEFNLDNKFESEIVNKIKVEFSK